jgi:hypothetical protein
LWRLLILLCDSPARFGEPSASVRCDQAQKPLKNSRPLQSRR